MSLSNVDYKKISFTRSDGVDVVLSANLNDPTDLNEDFLVLDVRGIDTPIERDLFYWIDRKRWTLNEIQYFALNNTLCVRIYDKANTELASYGICSNISRIHDSVFDINFD